MEEDIIDIVKDELSKGLSKDDVREILSEAGFEHNDIESALIKIEDHKNNTQLKEMNKTTITRVAMMLAIIIISGFFLAKVFLPQQESTSTIGLASQYAQYGENLENASIGSYAMIKILPRNTTETKKITDQEIIQDNIDDKEPTKDMIDSSITVYARDDHDITVKEYERNNFIQHDSVGLITQLYCNKSDGYIKFNLTNVKDVNLSIYRGDLYRPDNEIKFVYNGNNIHGVYCDGKEEISVGESLICVIRDANIRDGNGFDQGGINRLLVQTKLLNDNTRFRCA